MLRRITSYNVCYTKLLRIRCREAAAIERHERPQVRRQYRQYRQHHPFGFVARLDERLEQLETFRQALDLGFGARRVDVLADLQHFTLQIDSYNFV